MKKQVKDFLLKKRFFRKGVKVLKNKKGFSLMEVLIAVAIIAIISGIAVPQYIAQKDNAAKVAAETSAGNISKAFKNCVALESFDKCDTLSEIKVSCPAGSQCDGGGASPKFCAELHRGETGSDFKVCISIDSTTGTETRSYGGALLANITHGDVCHLETSPSGTCTDDSDGAKPMPGLVSCTQASACGTNVTAQGNTCGKTYTCEAPSTNGDCDTGTGLCS